MTVFFNSRVSCGIAAALMISGMASAATPGGEAPATGVRAIAHAYDRLVTILEQNPDDRPGEVGRANIVAAAETFRNAISRDGNARPVLSADARNIVISLSDGTFSVAGSIAALRRDADDGLVEVGPWQPPFAGSRVPDSIGMVIDQRNEGDCVGISVIKAFSVTPTGDAILRKIVTRNADDSFNVSFPGGSSTVQQLGPDGLEQYGRGDPAAAAIVGAMFQYFHLNSVKGSLPTNKVMELLAGRFGDHDRLADADSTPGGIAAFLRRNSAAIGSNMAMVFGGRPGRNGEWTKGDGHAFAVIRIDATSGILTYTNPWNEQVLRTIAIDTLARQTAGTSADFETVTFHRKVM